METFLSYVAKSQSIQIKYYAKYQNVMYMYM